METKTIICDICKKKVGVKKCAICGKDLCEDNSCKETIYVRLIRQKEAGYIGTLDSFELCNNCVFDDKLKKVMNNMDIYYNEKLKFAEKVVGCIKKNLIVEKL